MEIHTFIPFLLFSLVMCITPGAGNITLLSIANRYGFNKALPFVLGTSFGVLSVFIGANAGVVSLLTSYPNLYVALKYLGAVYLLYIAWHIATFSITEVPQDDTTTDKAAGFIAGTLIQLLNPKAWITAMTVFSQFINPADAYVMQTVSIITTFTVVTLVCTLVWAYFGAMLKKWLNSPHQLLWVNRSLAVVLVGSVVSMLV